jgi:uncharacterized protein (DUF736 family)
LRKPEESYSEYPPVYEIFEPNNMGEEVNIGAVWERKMKASGQVFLGGNIDDPSFPEPLPIALFGDEFKGFEVKWRRERGYPLAVNVTGNGGNGQQRRTGGQRPSGGGFPGGSTAGPGGEYVGAGGGLDDDIPFD